MDEKNKMIRAMADSEACKALRMVLEKIAAASRNRPQEFQKLQPRLVAVGKTKPLSKVKEIYRCGQRHFGENYVQELEEKGHDPELQADYSEIKWHFIGHLQSNKIKKVLGVPNLFMLETIDSQKLALAVNKTWQKLEKPERLKVMVQVNSSAEENKHGCDPGEAVALVACVIQDCPHLQFAGLMTIGSFTHDYSQGPNPDFECLVRCKADVCEKLGLDPDHVELSMGMSNDFEHAIEIGSTNVRVGSTLFGAREYKLENRPAAASNAAQSSEASANSAAEKMNSLDISEKS